MLQKNMNVYNLNWSPILLHWYRILMIGGSGSWKTNAWLILIKKQDFDAYIIIDKIYLCVKDPNEEKYKWLIKKRKKSDLKILKNPKALIPHSNSMQDVHKNIEYYNPDIKCNIYEFWYD